MLFNHTVNMSQVWRSKTGVRKLLILDIDPSLPSSSESFICTSYTRGLTPENNAPPGLSILPLSHSHVPSNDPRELKTSQTTTVTAHTALNALINDTSMLCKPAGDRCGPNLTNTPVLHTIRTEMHVKK